MAREWTRKSIEELARSVYGRMGNSGGGIHVVPYTFGLAQGGPLSSGDWNKSGVFDGSNVDDPNSAISFLHTQYGEYYYYNSSTLPVPILQMGYRQNDYPYNGFSCFKGGEVSDLVDYSNVGRYVDPECWFQFSIINSNFLSRFRNYLQNLSTAATTFIGHSLAHFTYGTSMAYMSSSLNIGIGITIPVVKYGSGTSQTVTVYAYDKNAVLKNLAGHGNNLEVYDSNNNIVGLQSDMELELKTSSPYIWLPTNSVFLSYLQHITAEWSNTTPSGIMFLEVPSNCWGEMTVEEIVNKIFKDFPMIDDTTTLTIDSYI
jgi:hypothetical protein